MEPVFIVNGCCFAANAQVVEWRIPWKMGVWGLPNFGVPAANEAKRIFRAADGLSKQHPGGTVPLTRRRPNA